MKNIKALLNSDQSVFSIEDLKFIWREANANSVRQYVKYHIKAANLIRLQRGIYALKDRTIDTYELGTKLRRPSYVSFETVLFQNHIIFQWDNHITLASRDSRELQVAGKLFEYRSLKDSVLLNNNGVESTANYYIASLERAWLDLLYLNPDFYIDNPRGLDFSKAHEIALTYGTKSIYKLIEKWENYARSL